MGTGDDTTIVSIPVPMCNPTPGIPYDRVNPIQIIDQSASTTTLRTTRTASISL